MNRVKNIIILFLSLISSEVLCQNYNSGLHNISSPYLIDECKTILSYKLKGNAYSVDTKTFMRPVLREEIDSIVDSNKDRPGPFIHRKQFFDSLGRETKSLNISGLFGEEYLYDSLGRLKGLNTLVGEYNHNTKMGRYGEYFLINHSATMDWTKKGDKVIGICNEIDGEKIDSVIYTIDTNSNILKIESILNGKKRPTYLYYYDSLNRIISSKYLNSKGIEKFNWTYTYNEFGFLQSYEKRDENGGVKETYSNIIDSVGNVMQVEITTTNSKLKLEYDYVYDQVGNWIILETKRNGEFLNLQYRKIDYYN